MSETKEKEILDPEKEYYILVPKNQLAMEKMYQYDIYDENGISDNFYCMIFHEDTFNYMEKRLFDFINVRCNLLINMYEEEIAEKEQLQCVLAVTDMLISNSEDERFLKFASDFREMVTLAIESNTNMGFYF